MNKRLCIGLLTYCNDIASPERFKILKRAVGSIRQLKRDDVFIYVWDNNSSLNVKNFLRSQDFFDEIYFSDKNLFDVVAVNFLAKRAKELDTEFVCYLEDDLLFYDYGFLDSCFSFMDKNNDCGTLRILKYEFNKKKIYDKILNHPMMDRANAQRHYNQISKKHLEWEHCGEIGNYTFYKNNWHWYTFPTICRREVFEKIIPKEDCRPLQAMELYMMKKYFNLNLKVGVLNDGAVKHLAVPTAQTSQRLQFEIAPGPGGFPVIMRYQILSEINSARCIKEG